MLVFCSSIEIEVLQERIGRFFEETANTKKTLVMTSETGGIKVPPMASGETTNKVDFEDKNTAFAGPYGHIGQLSFVIWI